MDYHFDLQSSVENVAFRSKYHAYNKYDPI